MQLPEIQGLTDALTLQEITKGETTFQIERLSPMEGYKLLDDIRTMIGEHIPDALQQTGDPLAILVATIGKIPHKDMEIVRKKLFENIQFSRPDARQPRPLYGSEDIAFQGLDAGVIYELIVRGLAVNFTDTLLRIQGSSEAEDKTSNQSPPKQSQASSLRQSRRNTSTTRRSTKTT